MQIQNNLQMIRQQIEQCCADAKRDKSAVKLLAVSKTKSAQEVFVAYQAGQILYFENRQVFLEWHFIGPLQSNKTRLVAEHFDWMQTLDRIKIADRLNAQRPAHKAPLNVLIQINISNEENKSGIMPDEMFTLAKHIQNLPHLRLRGLMAIPEMNHDYETQIRSFNRMNELFQQLKAQFPKEQIDTLSMGMSDDMPNAIKCGSTMVRIGTAIFGKRN